MDSVMGIIDKRNVLNEGRDVLIDFARGIATILMVLGHNIQYGSGNYVFSNGVFERDYLFKFIYSFHMPLFMFLSGYAFYYTICKYEVLDVVKNRARGLLIPMISFAMIIEFKNLCTKKVRGWQGIFDILYRFVHRYWFVWAVLACTFLLLFGVTVFKDRIFYYILICILGLFIPDFWYSYFIFFLFPFFVIGYYVCKLGVIECSRPYTMYILIVSTVIYCVLYYSFSSETYIYGTKYSLLGKTYITQLVIDMHRFIIGLVGIILIMIIIDWIYKKINRGLAFVIGWLGRCSLFVYFLSTTIFNNIVLPKVTSELKGINYGISLIETIIVLAICSGIIIILRKYSFTKCLILGEKYL